MLLQSTQLISITCIWNDQPCHTLYHNFPWELHSGYTCLYSAHQINWNRCRRNWRNAYVIKTKFKRNFCQITSTCKSFFVCLNLFIYPLYFCPSLDFFFFSSITLQLYAYQFRCILFYRSCFSFSIKIRFGMFISMRFYSDM